MAKEHATLFQDYDNYIMLQLLHLKFHRCYLLALRNQGVMVVHTYSYQCATFIMKYVECINMQEVKVTIVTPIRKNKCWAESNSAVRLYYVCMYIANYCFTHLKIRF